MFGYSADEAIGENINILIPEPYASKHDSYIEKHEETHTKKIIRIDQSLVTVVADKTLDANSIIKAADEALYKAKDSGRNSIEVSILK